MRFDKKMPEDFGLISSEDPEIFIMPVDNSCWKKRSLYDFGWGKENGYYRLPIPGFDQLIDIILNSDILDNKYGAGAIILDDYGDQLLKKCQEIFNKEFDSEKYSEFFDILQLRNSINRSSILGKSTSQISDDFRKWTEISERILKHN